MGDPLSQVTKFELPLSLWLLSAMTKDGIRQTAHFLVPWFSVTPVSVARFPLREHVVSQELYFAQSGQTLCQHRLAPLAAKEWGWGLGSSKGQGQGRVIGPQGGQKRPGRQMPR